MGRLDLFALALNNDVHLADELAAARAGKSPEDMAKMERFCHVVQTTGGISVNMKPYKLLGFLRAGRYLTVREIAAEQAASSTSGRSPEDVLRDMQGAYYDRRVLFETSFEDGERFAYGALNIGGTAGVSGYGIFCAFLADEATSALRSAYLPDDSLKRYVKPATPLVLESSTLGRDVATGAQRHSLAALKHQDDLATSNEGSWGTLLCGPGCYVEAIFVGEVLPTQVSELRMEREALLRLSDMAFDDMMGTLAPAHRVELEEYNACMEKLEELDLAGRVREV